jgi:hypothetical protein
MTLLSPSLDPKYVKPLAVSILIPLYTNETAIDGQLCLGIVDLSVEGGIWKCLNTEPDIQVTKDEACGSYLLLASIKQSGIYAVIETGEDETGPPQVDITPGPNGT